MDTVNFKFEILHRQEAFHSSNLSRQFLNSLGLVCGRSCMVLGLGLDNVQSLTLIIEFGSI